MPKDEPFIAECVGETVTVIPMSLPFIVVLPPENFVPLNSTAFGDVVELGNRRTAERAKSCIA